MPLHPHISTLVDLLEHRAGADGDRVAFSFAGRDHTWAALGRDSTHLTACLRERGVHPGDRVLLVLPNGAEFFAAFYGVLGAGAVPVPLFPNSGADRIVDLANACDASLLVVAADGSGETISRLEESLAERGVAVLRAPPIGSLSRGSGRGTWTGFRRADAQETALIQYTSGSTGDPKGVVLSHENLLTNARQMITGMEITPHDVFVSWLPVHHDMGLILMTLVPFLVGARLVLLPSTLTDVRPWLNSIAEHRGTFTAAPDFAYRLCLRAIRDPSSFDLGSLRVALNAAEPVRADTIRRFEETFSVRRVMVSGYGLAEATVGVAMQPPGTPPVVSERGLVAIGRPFPGVRLHIVGEDGEPVAPDETGELVVESPANTSGYYRNPRATADLFWRPGCIRTGDVAYRDRQEQIFLVGRMKNIILQGGRNIAPQELEETVDALPFVRRAAAVGVDRGGFEGEQAYVFVELRRAARPSDEHLEEMARLIVERLHERIGLRPGRVILLRPRSIPRTANGKIRHAALRTAYLDGDLRDRGCILFPDWEGRPHSRHPAQGGPASR